MCQAVTENSLWLMNIGIKTTKELSGKPAFVNEYKCIKYSQIRGKQKETVHLVELESSSVSLLQEKAGFGAALGRHSITTRPFLAASTLFTGLCSNVGAQSEE